jgi:uncharacterized protein (TIGR03067 family)
MRTPVDDEIAKFQGTWEQIAYERDGIAEPVDEEQGWRPRTTFRGNTFVVTIADGTVLIEGTFAIDASKEPKTVDYTDTFGADAGSTFPAIYYFERDTLFFCAATAGQGRPTSFKTRVGEVLRVHRRVAE